MLLRQPILNSVFSKSFTSNFRLVVTQADIKDTEYQNAIPYNKIPGPSKLSLFLANLPGGRYYNLSFKDLLKASRADYGNFLRLPGLFGKPDIVITFEPEHFQKVFRTEGPWPKRTGLETMEYYRAEMRPDLFGRHQGLIISQNKQWADFRTAVNQVMMQPKTAKLYVSKIDVVVTDFLKRIRDIRNPSTMQLPENFEDELNRWALESLGTIALDTRLGLMSDKYDEKATKVIQSVKTFFDLVFDLEFKPSLWKIAKTPNFHKLMKALDTLADISQDYIEEAKKRIESIPENEKGDHEKSILEKLLKIDPVIAQVMAMDMIFAGVDTTSSAFTGLLYMLAKNPDKQESLRQELLTVLPEKDTPLTPEKMSRMPYLRACIKEGLRLYPIVAGNSRGAGQDLVLGGYQVPKGINIFMPSTILQDEDNYFPDALQFVPERWLRDQSGAKCPASAKSAHPFVYMPFGFGPRMCIGRRFAEMEIEILTTRIIRNFAVTWDHPDLKFRFSTINTPEGKLMFTFNDIKN